MLPWSPSSLTFDFSNDILEALVKQKIKNLEEFRYFFESESEIGLWVQKLSLGEHQVLADGPSPPYVGGCESVLSACRRRTG